MRRDVLCRPFIFPNLRSNHPNTYIVFYTLHSTFYAEHSKFLESVHVQGLQAWPLAWDPADRVSMELECHFNGIAANSISRCPDPSVGAKEAMQLRGYLRDIRRW